MYRYLDFFFFQITSYNFFMILALIIVIIGSFIFAKKRNFKTSDTLWMLMWTAISVFLGARIFNILVNYDRYQKDFLRIFSLHSTWLSLYGGLLAGIITWVVISKFRKISLYKFADTVIPFVAIWIATMRVWCFLNWCCYGKETDLPWGVTFPEMSLAHIHQISNNIMNSMTVHPVHPTQIYELIAVLLGAFIVFYILKKQKINNSNKHWIAFFTFLIWFSAFRLANMYLRELPYSDTILYIVYPIFYLLFILLCLYFLRKIITKK